MPWKIVVSEPVKELLETLTSDEQAEVLACIQLLREHGPELSRPYADTLTGTRLPNLKELRIRHGRRHFRILFAFDVERSGILLVGGDKVPLGNKRFYRKYIPLAEELFAQHLATIASTKEGKGSSGGALS